MPFALLFVGMILIITGFQNTYSQFGKLVAGDFTGDDNFIYWVISLGAVGSIGYAKDLQGFSRAFMALIILVMIFKKDTGLFGKLTDALKSGTSTPVEGFGAPLAGAAGGASGGGSSGGGLGNLISIGSTIAGFL